MGMFDYIRVDPSLVPPRPTHISKREYQTEIDEITGNGAQTKVLTCTLDSYEITADGRLLLTSASRDREGMSAFSDSELADTAIPCADRDDCRWVNGFTGEIMPGSQITFRIEQGRVVSVDFRPFSAPAPQTRLQRAERRAEQMARHFGENSRRGRKWANKTRRISKKLRRNKYLVIDEYHSLWSQEESAQIAAMWQISRHRSHSPVIVSQSINAI